MGFCSVYFSYHFDSYRCQNRINGVKTAIGGSTGVNTFNYKTAEEAGSSTHL